MLAAFAPVLLLALIIACVPARPATADHHLSVCESSEQLEILNDAVNRVLEGHRLEPVFACDIGPWRTFHRAGEPFFDSRFDFVTRVETVPEPRGAATDFTLAAVLLWVLVMNRRRAARRATGQR